MNSELPISVIILTFNSAGTIDRTLRAAAALSDDIHVVDSYSTDNTVEVVTRAGALLVQHHFENYSRQRNWASEYLPLRHEWQLHLDADEIVTPELRAELVQLFEQEPTSDGYVIPRLVTFLGRELRHGGMFPIYHLRLFRRGRGRCEDRAYDQHFVLDGVAGRLTAPFIDRIDMPLSEWTRRHNIWSDAEVTEATSERALRPGPTLASELARRRRAKTRYYRLPLLWRAWGFFFYRYILLQGFRDGKPGLIFHVLQGLWFRFLVDAKIYEVAQHQEVS